MFINYKAIKEKKEMVVKGIYSVLVVVITGLIGGCASAKPPLEDLKIAKKSLSQVGEVTQDEEARRYLQRAKEEFAKAKEMMAKKEYEKAKYFAQKATADARVAKLKAQNSTLKEEIQKWDIEVKKAKRDFVTIHEEVK